MVLNMNRMLKLNKKYILVSVLIISFLSYFIAYTSPQTNQRDECMGNGAYVIKYNDYLYYYNYELYNGAKIKSCNLYKQNLKTGEVEFVDNICTNETHIESIIKMFEFDGRLYYGVSEGNNISTSIYSIGDFETAPRFEGKIDEFLNADSGEFVNSEFKIFKYRNQLYILGNNKIYRLKNGKSKEIKQGISSIWIDGRKVYFSKIKSNGETGGIFCYNTLTRRKTEIVSEDKIRNFNAGTVMGGQVSVKNIIVDDDTIYFLSSYYMSSIVKHPVSKNGQIEDITKSSRTQSFSKYKDMLFYKNYNKTMQSKLCSISIKGENETSLIPSIYSYNIYDDTIYYYMFCEPYIPQLRKYDMITQIDELIEDFR